MLIWVILNFNIKTSITIHFLHNLIIILPIFIYIQFPNTESKSVKLNKYKITWQKTPVFNGNIVLLSRPNNYSISTQNISPSELYKAFALRKEGIRDLELFSKYNISIEKLDDSAKKLDSLIIKSILLKANLIIENK